MMCTRHGDRAVKHPVQHAGPCASPRRSPIPLSIGIRDALHKITVHSSQRVSKTASKERLWDAFRVFIRAVAASGYEVRPAFQMTFSNRKLRSPSLLSKSVLLLSRKRSHTLPAFDAQLRHLQSSLLLNSSLPPPSAHLSQPCSSGHPVQTQACSSTGNPLPAYRCCQ
jgi:hypothetical protein